MARMSDPQMVDAFMASRTWPGPGSGFGRSRMSVLELPGRKTPRMPVPQILCSLADEGERSDLPIVGPPPYRSREVCAHLPGPDQPHTVSETSLRALDGRERLRGAV